MSITRKLMRSITRVGQARKMSGAAPLGTHRAGMHQMAEQAYLRTRCAFADTLDLTPAFEEMIPPEADDNEEVQKVADSEIVITEEPENPEEESEIEETLSADYAAGQIPVLDPDTGGTNHTPRELVYDPGNGEPKEIELPDVTRSAIHPFVAELENPSANVPAGGNA